MQNVVFYDKLWLPTLKYATESVLNPPSMPWPVHRQHFFTNGRVNQ